jgi:hypothetical protein
MYHECVCVCVYALDQRRSEEFRQDATYNLLTRTQLIVLCAPSVRRIYIYTLYLYDIIVSRCGNPCHAVRTTTDQEMSTTMAVAGCSQR